MYERRALSLAVLFLGLISAAARAQNVPVKITADDAAKHLIKRVDPVVPPLAKVTKVGGAVSADIIVAPDGAVESVKVVSGSPLLSQSAADAIKQWKFTPFVENGQPVRVATQVSIFFPGEIGKDEQPARQAYFPVFGKCQQLVQTQKYAEAEMACSEAVGLSDKLPSDAVLERSMARSFLGHARFLQGKFNEALPAYIEALGLDEKYLTPNDADLATGYANLGRAYFRLRDFEKADSLYQRSVNTFEAAILGLPSMKENYTRRLRNTLLEYAQLKRAMGREDAAVGLEKKADSL